MAIHLDDIEARILKIQKANKEVLTTAQILDGAFLTNDEKKQCEEEAKKIVSYWETCNDYRNNGRLLYWNANPILQVWITHLILKLIPNGKLTRFDSSHDNFDRGKKTTLVDILIYLNALQQHSSLTALILDNPPFNFYLLVDVSFPNLIAETCKDLLRAIIKNNASLTFLKLRGHGDLFTAVVEPLKANKKLKSLSLPGVEPKYLNEVLEVLRTNPITAFNLGYFNSAHLPENEEKINNDHFQTRFHNHAKGLHAFFMALRTSSITHLDLSNCELGEDNYFTTSVFLSLANNNYNEPSNHTVIRNLDLSNNPISDSSLQSLLNIFNSTGITTLNLTNCELVDSSISFIAGILRNNHSLRELILKQNHISCKGIVELANALRINTSLTHLNLDENKFGDKLEEDSDKLKAIEALTDAATVHKNLENFTFSSTINDIKGARECFVKLLKDDHCLNFIYPWKDDDRGESDEEITRLVARNYLQHINWAAVCARIAFARANISNALLHSIAPLIPELLYKALYTDLLFGGSFRDTDELFERNGTLATTPKRMDQIMDTQFARSYYVPHFAGTTSTTAATAAAAAAAAAAMAAASTTTLTTTTVTATVETRKRSFHKMSS